VDVESSF
jgi:hypothetical protein